jgi:hypothetical protein
MTMLQTSVNSVYNTDLCRENTTQKLVNRANDIPGGQKTVEHMVNLMKQLS